MSHDVPPFLAALGLRGDADERAVRQAYARQLKKIDPAADPEGFQALRSAYEVALQWSRRVRAASPPAPLSDPPIPPESAETAPPGPEAPEVEHGSDPHAAGNEVFGVFAQAAHAGFVDEPSARRALDTALSDERLINLEARTFFEWRVLCLLLDGWRPGHEFLLGPACACFDWEQDRRRLELFGRAGAALDAAIQEKLAFFRQPPAMFEAQRNLVRSLRNPQIPSKRVLIDEMPPLQGLLQRYPYWLRIVTSEANFHRRWEAWEALDPKDRQKARGLVPAPRREPVLEKKRSSWNWWLGAFVIFAAFRLLASLGETTRPTYRPPLAPNPFQVPATDRSRVQSPGDALLQGQQPLFNPPAPAPLVVTLSPAPKVAASGANKKVAASQRPQQRKAEAGATGSAEATRQVFEPRLLDVAPTAPQPVHPLATNPRARYELVTPPEYPWRRETTRVDVPPRTNDGGPSKYDLTTPVDGATSRRIGQ